MHVFAHKSVCYFSPFKTSQPISTTSQSVAVVGSRRKRGGVGVVCLLLAMLAVVCLPQTASATAVAAYEGQPLGGGFNLPQGVAVDGSGNVYVADTSNSLVKKMPAGCATSSCVTTLGGGFSNPVSVAVDGSGNVYVADFGNTAVKEMPGGCASSSCVTTLGGGFSSPAGVAVDGSGNVYVADTFNSLVKEMPAGCASSSCVTTLGGGFSSPAGVAVDGSGNVYVADNVNNLVKEIPVGCATSSCVTTLGGGFSNPQGVAVDGSGNVYIADSNHNLVKEMPAGCASSSCVTTLGGSFTYPTGVAVDGSGNLYVADTSNYAIRELVRAGVKLSSTAVGSNTAQTLTFTIYSAGTIGVPKVLTQGDIGLDFTDNGTGTCTTNGTSHTYAVNDTCTVDVKFAPQYAGTRYGAVELVNNSGNLLATALISGTGNGPQLAFNAPLTATTLGGGFTRPLGVAVDSSGNVYVADIHHSVFEMPLAALLPAA
jgi:sugar lactone lactonase YvrE